MRRGVSSSSFGLNGGAMRRTDWGRNWQEKMGSGRLGCSTPPPGVYCGRRLHHGRAKGKGIAGASLTCYPKKGLPRCRTMAEPTGAKANKPKRGPPGYTLMCRSQNLPRSGLPTRIAPSTLKFVWGRRDSPQTRHGLHLLERLRVGS